VSHIVDESIEEYPEDLHPVVEEIHRTVEHFRMIYRETTDQDVTAALVTVQDVHVWHSHTPLLVKELDSVRAVGEAPPEVARDALRQALAEHLFLTGDENETATALALLEHEEMREQVAARIRLVERIGLCVDPSHPGGNVC
jgi:hypothetical protein